MATRDEQIKALMRLYPDMPYEKVAAAVDATVKETLTTFCWTVSKIELAAERTKERLLASGSYAAEANAFGIFAEELRQIQKEYAP